MDPSTRKSTRKSAGKAKVSYSESDDDSIAAESSPVVEDDEKVTKIQEKNRRAQRKFRERRKEKMTCMEQQISELQRTVADLKLQKEDVDHTNQSLRKMLESNQPHVGGLTRDPIHNLEDYDPIDMSFLPSHRELFLSNEKIRMMSNTELSDIIIAMFNSMAQALGRCEQDSENKSENQKLAKIVAGGSRLWTRCLMVEPVRTREVVAVISSSRQTYAIPGHQHDSHSDIGLSESQKVRMADAWLMYKASLEQMLGDRIACSHQLMALKPDPGNELQNVQTFLQENRVVEQLKSTMQRENSLFIRCMHEVAERTFTPMQLARFVLYNKPAMDMLSLCKAVACEVHGAEVGEIRPSDRQRSFLDSSNTKSQARQQTSTHEAPSQLSRPPRGQPLTQNIPQLAGIPAPWNPPPPRFDSIFTHGNPRGLSLPVTTGMIPHAGPPSSQALGAIDSKHNIHNPMFHQDSLALKLDELRHGNRSPIQPVYKPLDTESSFLPPMSLSNSSGDASLNATSTPNTRLTEHANPNPTDTTDKNKMYQGGGTSHPRPAAPTEIIESPRWPAELSVSQILRSSTGFPEGEAGEGGYGGPAPPFHGTLGERPQSFLHDSFAMSTELKGSDRGDSFAAFIQETIPYQSSAPATVEQLATLQHASGIGRISENSAHHVAHRNSPYDAYVQRSTQSYR